MAILGKFAASSDTVFIVDLVNGESQQLFHKQNVPIINIQSPQGNDTDDLIGFDTMIQTVGFVPALLAAPDTEDSFIGRMYSTFPGLRTVLKPADSSTKSCVTFNESAPQSMLEIFSN